MCKIWHISIFLILFLSPFVGNAQFSGISGGASSLVVSPQYPEPNEQVTLTLNDYSINTNGAQIQWFVDGTEITSVKNKRTHTLISNKLGEKQTILVLTTLANGTILKARATILPIRIDMLVEADTLTPSFYKGRALPSSGSTVRVTAFPFTGKTKDPHLYSYTWRIGDTVQAGGSQYGKNFITFVPDFKKNIRVSVDVFDATGARIANESISVPLVEPELYFYDINPLRGISENAMSNDFIFSGDEIHLRAEPYFINSDLLNKKPHRQWKLNNVSIENISADPQEITLRKQGSTGRFSLEFHIRNLTQLLQGVKKTITIIF